MANDGRYVEGLRSTVRQLEQLGVEVDDLKDVFGPIAEDGAQIASAAAPSRSGRLRASIRGNRAKNKAVIRGGSKRVPYLAPLNYGWPKRNIRGRGFMQEPDRVIGPQLAERLEAGLRDVIERNNL
jgi:hypothetical protein